MPTISLSGITVTAVDITAPILTSPTGTATGQTTATGAVSTDESGGTLYFYTSTNATETAATVVSSGASQAVSSTGVQNVSFTGLGASTAYYAHYVHDDAAANRSTRVSSSSFTTDAAAGVTISLSGITVTLPVPVITSITGAVAGGTVTINTSGTPNLTGATTVTAAYGGVALTSVTVIDADTATGVMPVGGFALGSSNLVTITVDGRTSGGFAAPFASALGSHTTLSVDYLNLHMDSKLRELRYALLEAGDQFEHATRTLGTTATPAGYLVSMSATGLLTVIGAENESEPVYLDFAIIDALDEVGVYRRSNVSRWTLHTSIPTEAPFITSTSSTATTYTVNWTFGGTNLTGFQYRIGGGAWTAIGASPLIVTGATASTAYTVEVRAVNGTIPGEADLVVVSTTSATDTTPDAFTLADQTGVQVSTQTWSAPAQVLGVIAGTDVAVTLAGDASRLWRYSTDSGQTWSGPTASAGNVRLNYLVQVSVTSTAGYSAPISATLTIGGVSDTFTVTTRADDVRPVVTLIGLPSMVWELGQEWVDPGATATDNVNGTLAVTADISPNVNAAGQYTITYSATDAAGNVGSALRVVTVFTDGVFAIDSAPALINRGGAALQATVSGAAVAPTLDNTSIMFGGVALVVDSITGTGPWVINFVARRQGDGGNTGIALVQLSNNGYPLTITVGAESATTGNIPFPAHAGTAYVDLTSVATGQNTIDEHFSEFALSAGYQVFFRSSTIEDSIPVTISPSGVVTYATPPTRQNTFWYQIIRPNLAGISASYTYGADVIPPVITLNGLATVSLLQNSAWTDPGATAIDSTDGNLTDQIVVTGTINTATLGQQTLTYTVTDAAGNTASVQRFIDVLSDAAFNMPDIVPHLLAVDVQSMAVYSGRDNTTRVRITHDSVPVDLYSFTDFTLYGLTAEPLTSDADPAVFDITPGGGAIDLMLGPVAESFGVHRLTLVAFSTLFPNGVVLFEPSLSAANVTAIVINA